MGDSARPKWDYKISEERVWRLRGSIKKITHHWELTGVDTSRDWLEFHPEGDGKFRAPSGWDELFEFRPDHRGLISPNYKGHAACKRLDEIKAWEKQNANDIAELKRLQAKLGLDEIEYIRVSDKLKLLADLKKAQNNE